MCWFFRFVLIALTASAIGAGVAGSRSLQTTLIVTSTADSGAGSLRDAIAAATDGDIIQFDATLNGQTINLTSAPLDIDKNITISGFGPNLLAIATPQDFDIFRVMSGHTVTIEGLTIQHSAFVHNGGGIVSDQAMLTVTNCIVQDNTSYSGGGIYNRGAMAILTILNSIVFGNVAEEGPGGGIYNDGGTVTIFNSTVSRNVAGSLFQPEAGGILNAGTMEISRSRITDNEAGVAAGGIDNFGTLTIVDSTIDGNRAGDQQNGSGDAGGIYNSGTLTITNSTVSRNQARSGKGLSGSGGGIYNRGAAPPMLTITNSTISDNVANEDGGGIDNFGTLIITSSTISNNTAFGGSGGIHNHSVLQIGNAI
jgi:hypothetical protein